MKRSKHPENQRTTTWVPTEATRTTCFTPVNEAEPVLATALFV